MRPVSTDIIYEKLKLRFNNDVREIIIQHRRRIVIHIRKEALLEICSYILNELSYRFIIATGMVSENGFEIIYHFSDDKNGCMINLLLELEESNPEIESLSNLVNAACWIEREIHELYGIKFKSHPDLTKLISDGIWKDNEYPYARKKDHNENRIRT